MFNFNQNHEIKLKIIFFLSFRKRFPVKVNCWFCNSNFYVPYKNSNSFECIKCFQYNGFNEFGDYNKVIKGKYLFKKENCLKNISKLFYFYFSSISFRFKQ